MQGEGMKSTSGRMLENTSGNHTRRRVGPQAAGKNVASRNRSEGYGENKGWRRIRGIKENLDSKWVQG